MYPNNVISKKDKSNINQNKVSPSMISIKLSSSESYANGRLFDPAIEYRLKPFCFYSSVISSFVQGESQSSHMSQ